jgi:threonylcarbamoyladenosine tRNA methylthiotransferase MtaB
MPQVDGATIKARAARLRRAGQAQVEAYLGAQLGRECPVLMEGPRVGRTEGFAEVAFAADQPVGRIVRARIEGHDCTRLLARGLPDDGAREA